MKRPSGLHRSYFWVKLVVAMATLFFASKTLQRDSATPSEHIVQRPVRRRLTQDLPTSSVEVPFRFLATVMCHVFRLLLALLTCCPNSSGSALMQSGRIEYAGCATYSYLGSQLCLCLPVS